MSSITASSNKTQEGTGPESAQANKILIAENQPVQQDHEDEEETRRRLDEWRAMAANLSGGFTQMPDRVRKDSTLSSNAKIVYEHLLGYMWSKDWCWPSQKTIAKELGISRRTVIRVCKELHERFYIEKWRRGLGRTNIYFVNPLSIVASTGIALTEINLQLPTSIKLNAPVAALYGTRYYANDPHTIKECQNDTSRSDKVTQPEAPESHTKHTKSNNTHSIEIASKNSTEAKKGTVFDSTPTTIRNTKQNEQENERDTKSNTETNSIENNRAGTAKEVKVAKVQPSAQAQAIAAATGIPAAHLTELGIATQPKKRPAPDFIVHKMTDFTRDLGDAPRSKKSNITRASKLYYFGYDYIREAQEDPEGWFVEQLNESKRKSLLVPGIKHRTGNRINRIPVFFTCLENLFELTPDELAYLRSDLPLLYPEDRDQ